MRTFIKFVCLLALLLIVSTVSARAQMLEFEYNNELNQYFVKTDDGKPFVTLSNLNYAREGPSFQAHHFFVIEQHGFYGVVNVLGKVIIPPQYENIIILPFNNSSCIRFAAKIQNKYGILNESGEIVVPFVYDDLENWILGFSEKLVFVRRDNLFGMIDCNGVEVLKTIYDRHNTVGYTPSLLPYIQKTNTGWLKKDGKWAAINHTGTFTTGFEYDSVAGIRCRANDYNHNLSFVRKGKHWGIVESSTGSIILPFEYDGLENLDNNGDSIVLFTVKKDRLWGLMEYTASRRCELRLPFQFDAVLREVTISMDNSPRGLKAQKNGRWGIIDATGAIKMPFILENEMFFVYVNRLFETRLNGYKVLINERGEQISPSGYHIKETQSHFCVITTNESPDGLCGIISTTGTILVQPRFADNLQLSGNRALVQIPGKLGIALLDVENDKLLTDFQTNARDDTGYKLTLNTSIYTYNRTNNNKTIFYRDIHYGVLDSTGKVILPCEFESIDFIGKNGIFAKRPGKHWSFYLNDSCIQSERYSEYKSYTSFSQRVKRDGKWAILCDTNGQEILPPMFDEAIFTERSKIMVVRIGNHWLFFDTEYNHTFIPTKYESISVTNEQAAAVKLGGKWGYVSLAPDSAGKFIIPPVYDMAEMPYNGYGVVRRGNLYGYVAVSGPDAGKEVVTPMYDAAYYVLRTSSDGLPRYFDLPTLLNTQMKFSQVMLNGRLKTLWFTEK